MPPGGSFLHEVFTARGCRPYFRGEFSLRNMRHLVCNWQAPQTGQLLGIGAVLRQLVPSVQRTYRHYRGESVRARDRLSSAGATRLFRAWSALAAGSMAVRRA
jgi:hypothetical protein